MSNARLKHGDGFKPKLIALSVAACFGLSATQASANPTGGTVSSGSASFSAAGNTLTITNTAGAIINWQSFSIGVNEITRFLQSSGSSAVLNRVIGKNGVVPQSVIDGVLSSNGRVFLLNSSGILIGAGARIDVAGFVASSLNLSDTDFLAGRMRFTETPGAGKVSNAGTIDTTSGGPGGRVFLIAPDVENSGIIRTPQGEIVLAAGKSVDLVSENFPFVTVTITADSERALNVGKLVADSGRIGMYGALVRQGGVAEANSAVVGANGEIRLVATSNVTLDAGSLTSASGGAQGGNIAVSAPVVVQAGDIRADGDAGGKIQVDAGSFLQAGTLSASGSAGGQIGVNAPHIIQTSSAVIAADGNGGAGGTISVDESGAPDGLLFSSAKYSATGDKGGDIKLLGHDIVLLGASADASGANGGGTILVGGDFHGTNPAVPNAASAVVNYSTTLKADATQNGDGGKIVVWSDKDTRFYGTASARGGAQSGNGGSMEISSGGDHLAMFGFADAGAPNGTAGTLLLDPKNIIIDSSTSTGTFGSFQLVDPHPGANEQFGSRVEVLPNQNVVVTDPNDSFTAAGAGAVYLFDSANGALKSALTGSSLNDHVGSRAIVVLSGGNFVVASPSWNNGAVTSAGAVTLVNGTSGLSGTVSATNSLVGSTANDQVGNSDILQVGSGNFVVLSPNWSNVAAASAGAVTFGSGTTGVVGPVSAANSLVGTNANDQIGSAGVSTLSNGNYVVVSPNWNGAAPQAGAVTFGDGTTGVAGTINSTNSLVGGTANDRVGFFGVQEVGNGNYVVLSPQWNNGAATLAGAVTFGSGTTGVAGRVSATNSLVGTSTNDQVGLSGAITLANGNYVVSSRNWDQPPVAGPAIADVGAVTFGSGTTGVSGVITTANSLVGTSAGDKVGSVVIPLSNGNYVVSSTSWTNPQTQAAAAGAVTFGDGTRGITGAVSATNSLVGTTAGDQVGTSVTPLTNGNYVVGSPLWDQPPLAGPGVANVGAATFASGTAGISGVVSAANSLVGTTLNDQVGGSVTPLTNGNYVVVSSNWTNPQTQAAAAGAVTFGDGTTGVAGTVSSTNSLVGSTLNDNVGSSGITSLTNGNYVVSSPLWNNNFGAVTFGNGTSGVAGAVSAGNSLVGTTINDFVGSGGITQLFNGNYVVNSPNWSNGAAATAGAVTFGDGKTGTTGTVSVTNSLVGSTSGDQVGLGGVTPLLNGNYVVSSFEWNNGAATFAGAVTLVNGANGNIVASGTRGGAVSASNSLVGTATDDFVGSGGVVPLFFNDNYVVMSPDWNGGRGAVTFGSGTTGVTGAVSSANSLVGSTAGDQVGSGGFIPLFGGNYLVVSPDWNNAGAANAGAVTWVNGTNGNVFGQASPGAVVSASNSLVGGTTNDRVGSSSSCECSVFFPLPNGDIVLRTLDWTNPATAVPAPGAGAVTVISGTAGIAGLVSPTNSLVGSAPNDHFGSGDIIPLANGNFVVSSPNAANGGLLNAGLVHVVTPGTAGTGGVSASGQTFAADPTGDVTITPSAITKITNTGTALVLQANNDITLNTASDIVTVPVSAAGGDLTLQAGRSIVLNSSITTANGNLTLTANETASNGVVTANRDTGAAVITQAAGTTLNAGSGTITITMSTGTDASGTPAANGAISLANVNTSGNLSILNAGLSPGSDVLASGTLRGGTLAKLTANGALGSALASLQVATATLQAGASTGINITTNGAAPAMVNVIALNNTTSGDIVLNAHGGATTSANTLVSNPGGNVTINSFSPLDIGGGITAGNSIFLTTGGTSSGPVNDMSLAGLYTYNVSTGAFEVTVGAGGTLRLFTGSTPLALTAPLFPNPDNITRFTFLQVQDTGLLQLDVNTVIEGTNILTWKEIPPSIDGLEKKDKDAKKKGAVACK